MKYYFAALMLLYLLSAPAADGAIFYDIAVKGIYEDNVVGLLTDRAGSETITSTGPGTGTTSGTMGTSPGMGPGSGSRMYTGSNSEKKSDTSVDILADIGGIYHLNSRTSLFLTGSAERVSYSSFTDYNMTAGGVTAGVIEKFGNILTARVAASGIIKQFEDSERDGTACSGNISFKEQLSPSFWLRQGFLYERNSADSSYFTYSGTSLGIWAGFSAFSRTTLVAGYHYLVRTYEEPADFEETANTVSLGLEWEPFLKWFLDLQYDHRSSDSNLEGTEATSNIFSLGLRYSY